MKKYPQGLTLKAICDAIDAYRAQEDDVPEAGMIAAFEILLAAMDKPDLTAQPVKLPKSERLDGNGYGYYFDMDDVFVALESAGVKFEVQE